MRVEIRENDIVVSEEVFFTETERQKIHLVSWLLEKEGRSLHSYADHPAASVVTKHFPEGLVLLERYSNF